MTLPCGRMDEIPIFISKSNISTEVNMTGTWRFVRPVYREKTAPCSASCPVAEDIPKIEWFSTNNRYPEALKTILKENPFPAVCGRVCFHPCETACNRAGFDDPIAIHDLERFIGDSADQLDVPVEKKASNGKRMAIVGAGPAGLSAAYFLSVLGYACDVFEAAPEPGGLLRWGIPSYRLPASVLNKEIARIEKLGVRIHCNHPIDESFLAEARKQYQGIFIGCGYGKSITMRIPGSNLTRDGLQFLYQVRAGSIPELSGTAAIIGGGNTAIDVARSLIRIGVKPVIIYRRQIQDMPAFRHEIDRAIEEGLEIRELLIPTAIARQDGKITVSLQKMKTKEPGTDGRTRVIPQEGETESFITDHVFEAIGAEPSESWLNPSLAHDRAMMLSHCALVDGDIPVIYGGDLASPTKSVTHAIASGKQAAMVIDTILLKGADAVQDKLALCRVGNESSLSMEIYLHGPRMHRDTHVVKPEEINLDYFSHEKRVVPATILPENIPLDRRKNSFDEVQTTILPLIACQESLRCFNCGLCNNCDNCRIFCPEMAVLLKNESRTINLDYCKGCGICVVECPRNAMNLEEEKS